MKIKIFALLSILVISPFIDAKKETKNIIEQAIINSDTIELQKLSELPMILTAEDKARYQQMADDKVEQTTKNLIPRFNKKDVMRLGVGALSGGISLGSCVLLGFMKKIGLLSIERHDGLDDVLMKVVPSSICAASVITFAYLSSKEMRKGLTKHDRINANNKAHSTAAIIRSIMAR